MVATTKRRRGGQPGNTNRRIGPEPRRRTNIMIAPDVAEYARRVGDGNLSRGIELLVEFHRRKNN